MTTRVGVGVSARPSASAAGREAVEAALARLDGPADLLLTFATAGYDHAELVRTIHRVGREAGGEAALVGCTGEGLISRTLCSEGMHAVGVMALRSDVIRAETALAPQYTADSRAAGQALAAWIGEVAARDARLLVLLPDGLGGNCTDLLDVLQREHPALPIVGGAAGDAMALQRTHQYRGTEVASGAVAALLLCGDVRPRIAVSHGCSPLGLPRTITRARDGWVHELDGQRAWSVFQDYLDGAPEDLDADGTVQLCLGELLPEDRAADYDPHVVHTPLRLDRHTGALFFPGGGVREGQRVQLMQRDPEKIQHSAHACATRLAAQHRGRAPAAVLQFDCAGRGRMLFGSSMRRRVIDPVMAPFEERVPWLGLHTYGELAPLGNRTYVHGYTVALCALFEGRA